jgi:hypothetical protein
MKDPAIREEWAKRVARWRDSGLSAVEFGAAARLNPRSLRWWRWHLSKEGAPPKTRRRRSGPSTAMTKTAPVTLPPLTFVELASPVALDSLEVILPSSVRISVRTGFDDTTLGRLLDVLERRR